MKKKILKLEDLELEIYKHENKLNHNRPIKQKTLDEIFKITIIKKGI